MKNAELDDLENLANEVMEKLPPVYVGGDGGFYETDGEDEDLRLLPASEVIAMMYQARKLAGALRRALHDAPRRKVKA